MRRTAALIVGGGPAGAAAAIALARGGRRPLLLERTREPPDLLCGGFLSWRTRTRLADLGIDVLAAGATPVTRLRLFAGGRTTEAALPAPAAGLSRRTLDTLLLDRAIRDGAAVERGVSVRAAEGDGLRLDDGAMLRADALFLATGKHDLRGLARPRDAAGRDPAIGLRIRLARTTAFAGAIELHAFDRGYAGVVAQEEGGNLCLAVARSRLAEAGGDPRALLARLGSENPALGDRLATATGPVDAVAGVPYGWRARATADGLYRLGDQAAVIPSLAGEGIGIALASGLSAGRAHLDGRTAPDWQDGFAKATAQPVAVAGLIRRLAEGRARTLLPLLAGAAPSLVRRIAALTRVPD